MFDEHRDRSLRVARVLLILVVVATSIALTAWPTVVQTSEARDGNVRVTAATLVEGACVAVQRGNDSRIAQAWTQAGTRVSTGPHAQGVALTAVCLHTRPPRAVLSLHHVLLI